MVARCKECGKSIDLKKVAAMRGEVCSFGCALSLDAKKLGILALALIGIGIIMVLVGLFMDLAQSNEHWLNLAGAGGAGGGVVGMGIIFGSMSLIGYGFKKRIAKQEKLRIYHCIYCKEEVEKPDDKGPIVCMNCGKKTPICQICRERIMEEEDVYTLEPCGHTVHRSEVFSWLHKNKNCPACNEKIDKIDVDLKD